MAKPTELGQVAVFVSRKFNDKGLLEIEVVDRVTLEAAYFFLTAGWAVEFRDKLDNAIKSLTEAK